MRCRGARIERKPLPCTARRAHTLLQRLALCARLRARLFDRVPTQALACTWEPALVAVRLHSHLVAGLLAGCLHAGLRAATRRSLLKHSESSGIAAKGIRGCACGRLWHTEPRPPHPCSLFGRTYPRLGAGRALLALMLDVCRIFVRTVGVVGSLLTNPTPVSPSETPRESFTLNTYRARTRVLYTGIVRVRPCTTRI